MSTRAQQVVDFKPYCIQRLRTPLAYPADDIPSLLPYFEARELPAHRYAFSRPKSDLDRAQADALRAQYKKSLDALNALLRLEYMGSAEFEFGAFGTALTRIVHLRASLRPVTVVVASCGHKVELTGWAQSEHLVPLRDFIEAEACGSGSRMRLREPTYLRSACFIHDPHCDTVGWLDIDLGWFMTKDRRLLDGACRLLGLELRN